MVLMERELFRVGVDKEGKEMLRGFGEEYLEMEQGGVGRGVDCRYREREEFLETREGRSWEEGIEGYLEMGQKRGGEVEHSDWLDC